MVNGKGNNSLYAASKRGNLKCFKRLLSYENRETLKLARNQKSFFVAIKKQEIEIVGNFLKRGCDPNLKSKDGSSALCIASKMGFIEIVNLLISYGSRVDLKNKFGDQALLIASKNGHLEVVRSLLLKKSLLEQTNKNGCTALFIACEHGHSVVVQDLINRGARVNVKSKRGVFPLYIASRNGHLDVVKLLLGNDAWVDQVYEGWTSLMIATQNGSLDIIKVLIDHGAKIEQSDNIDGFNPLLVATENNHLEVVQYLLKKNAQIDRRNSFEETALHLACSNGYLNIMKTLISNGADVDSIDENECTPLMLACENGHANIVKEMLMLGVQLKEGQQGGLFSVDFIESEQVKNLILTYNDICNDFLELFNSNESEHDLLIKSNYGGHVKVHEIILRCRIEKGLNEILLILKCHKVNEIIHFVKWIYSGIVPQDSDTSGLIQEIASQFELDFQAKSGKAGLVKDLSKLYNQDLTKDFTIKVKNETIRVHKFILQARSGLYRALFLSVKDNSNEINDYTEKSLKTLAALIKYFYTDEIDQNLDKINFEELIDAVDYYQLSEKSSLTYQLDENL